MSDSPAKPGEPSLPEAGSAPQPETAAAWAEAVAQPLVAPTRPPERPTPRPPRIDPWAHRRGEPRIFALLWTIFLFAATGITMLSVVARGFPGPETMQPAARTLMMTVGAGMVLVWPLIRLSQQRDDRPVAGMVHDLIVVLVPVQAIVWPQTMWWLARWPLEVVAAVGLEFVAWGLLIGGLLAIAYAGDRGVPQTQRGNPLRRAGWMALILAIGLGPVVLAMSTRAEADVRWWWMLSPVTAVAELTRDRNWSGVTALVRPLHWAMIAGTAIFAAPLWPVAAVLSRGKRGVAMRAESA